MDWGSIIAAIEAAIESVLEFLAQIINALISALNAVFQAIWQTIVNVAEAIASVFTKIAAFFVHLWQDYILPAIHGLVHLYQEIHDWLQRVLGPVLNIIKRIRAWFYQYIYPWIKLAETILSVIRAFLSALRALGVKWAAKLDADIAAIQGYITGVLQGIVSTLNQASTWLAFAIDPLGIIRRDVFHMNLFSSAAQVARAASFGKNRFLTASEAQGISDDGNLKAGGAAIAKANADGSVTYGPSVQQMNGNFDLEWNNYGNPKMPN